MTETMHRSRAGMRRALIARIDTAIARMPVGSLERLVGVLETHAGDCDAYRSGARTWLTYGPLRLPVGGKR